MRRWRLDIAEGAVLPPSPAVSDLYYLTTGTIGLYQCLTAGVWTLYDTVPPAIVSATTTSLGSVILATDGQSAANLVPQATDSRLSNARTPVAHAASHASAGSDALSVTALGGFPGGTATFLRADQTFAAPAGGGSVTITPITVQMGATAVRSAAVVVTDAAVTPTTRILISQADGGDLEENSGDMDLLALSVRPAAGSFTVFATAPTPIRGPFRLVYTGAA